MTSFIKTLKLLPAVTAALLATSTHAAWTYSYNDTSGYTGSDVVFTTAASMDNNAFIRDVTGTGYRGGLQTFQVASAIEVESINILVNRLMDGATSSFRLYEIGSTAPGTNIAQADFNSYTLLQQETITISGASSDFGTNPPGFTDADSTFTWTLPNSTETLSTGTYYAFAVEAISDTSNSIVWRYDATGNYAGGVGFYKNDSSAQYESDTFNVGTSDWSLALVAIPEPSTFALVGLALGALLLFRRRR